MFLRNAWYVAAWEREIGETPYAGTILGDQVAIYRGASGRYGALADACPHRKVPLSMGRVKGDDVECGYHGLVFDCTGTCVRAPGDARPPQGAQVRSYPIEPRYGLLWIWMGEAATPVVYRIDGGTWLAMKRVPAPSSGGIVSTPTRMARYVLPQTM